MHQTVEVLVLAGAHDQEALRVLEEVRARGATAVACDAAAFPEQTLISLLDGDTLVDGVPLPFPGSVYLRGLATHPLSTRHADDLEARPRGLIAQCDEKRALLESAIQILERRGAMIVNSLEANAQHSRKPYQLDLLRSAGLPVPRWLATNDPRDVTAFAGKVGPAVYKPLAGGASVRLLESEDLAEDRLSALTLAPVLFQEYVPGVSVRAYVVGGQVVGAAEIQSPEIDYRRDEQAVVATALSAEEERAVLVAARACGMTFTGVDLIRSAGRFVVLECNPSPMFAVFEKKTGLNVAGPLARWLVCETS